MGSDENSGLSKRKPWKSFENFDSVQLLPGDTIKFETGSEFERVLLIEESGLEGKPIVLTLYGSQDKPAPAFTNNIFNPSTSNYGNCIRIKGDYVIVENLYFHSTVAELSGTIGFELMWELGAVYIDKTAHYCIVRNNEFYDCGVGIKSYGPHALITENYIHDCNRILKEWSWGPLAIWLGGDNQEVSYNRILNYSVVDKRISWGPGSYGGGADGGAIEIDDARYPKNNISIHHNYSSDNQGFIEVTWTDLAQNPPYKGFLIHHNISDDYQQFVALWSGSACMIDNNTIIRRKRNVNDWGVFNITEYNSKNLVRNNIVLVDKGVVIFNLGRDANAVANTIISNNLYYALDGELNIGLEGPGEYPLFDNPGFVNPCLDSGPGDYRLLEFSPAIDRGLDLKYISDFQNVKIPGGRKSDIGAFEYSFEK